MGTCHLAYMEGVRDKTTNYIIGKSRTLAQKKYKKWPNYFLTPSKPDKLGIKQATKVWLFWQMVYAQTRICPGNNLVFGDKKKKNTESYKIRIGYNQQEEMNISNCWLCHSSRFQSKNKGNSKMR